MHERLLRELALSAIVLTRVASASGVNLDQHGLTGSWYNSATGGQGFEIEVYPDVSGPGLGLLFAGWFTYDVTAAGGRRWYALQGDVSRTATSTVLQIFDVEGGTLNAQPSVVSTGSLGQATIQFSDCNSGLLAYKFNDGSGRSGTIPLSRLTPNVTCSVNGDNGSVASSYLLSGNWFNPSTSGQGFMFDFSPTINNIFAAWYTFKPNGHQIGGPASQDWYTFQSNKFVPGISALANIPIVETTGGAFDNPTAATSVQVGTGDIAFQSCNAMTLTYNFTGGENRNLSGSMNLQRVGPVPNGCSQPPQPRAIDPQYRVSAASPFAPNCDGVAANGTAYVNAEVEPSFAINPTNTANIVAAWQQDRWSTGGARGIVTGVSMDGGKTWTQSPLPFSRCGGGTQANGGNYARASDPWMSAAPDGTLHQIAIVFNNTVSAIVAARSTDGGVSWDATQTLIRDSGNLFNDKCSITADPVTPNHVYAVWDRLIGLNHLGPTEFTRSTDGGRTWEPPRAIYDPGVNNQTIGNLIVVMPNGMLVNLLIEIQATADGTVVASFLEVIRSSDNGVTWSTPSRIAQLLAVGTKDPNTGAVVRDGSVVPQIAVAPAGTLYVVWQDSRFSGGAHDGIALAQSNDGGVTWSAPVQVNSTTTVAAFTPNVHARADGMIGVSYYDFRPNTNVATTLLTDYWLARTTNGTTWMENQITGSFDIDLAPLTSSSDGYFIGDYQGLSSIGNVFVPLFVQTSNDANNRSDVFIAPQVSATTAVTAKAYRVAAPALKFSVTPEMLQRVSKNLTEALREGPSGAHRRFSAYP